MAPTVFSVTRGSDGAVIGLIDIDPATDPESLAGGHAELSYQVLPEYWGSGYGREAVSAAAAWAFENLTPDPPILIAITQVANAKSRRLLESIGMAVINRFIAFDAPQVMYSVDQASLRAATDGTSQ
jgi:RimJ/RimL family protein N-acetyltransferase